ncbi:MAG: acyl-CoA thioester hydrolase [Solirubrobacterales bacterium]|jgi:acyl-CoA thioester hydrolase|nr:acyl-CoA thioester hydrolase [Solirubrobacterales bacterium]
MSSAFRHPLRVRFHECDPQGIVFNANFLAYADIAITELYREAFGSWQAAMEEGGIDMVVAEAKVRYLAPLRFDEEVELVASVTRIGTTASTTLIAIERDGDAVAEVTLRHVVVDLKTREKAPIPDSLRAGLERYAA